MKAHNGANVDRHTCTNSALGGG